MMIEDLKDMLDAEKENPDLALPGTGDQPIYGQDNVVQDYPNPHMPPIINPLLELYGYQGEIPQAEPWPSNTTGTGPDLASAGPLPVPDPVLRAPTPDDLGGPPTPYLNLGMNRQFAYRNPVANISDAIDPDVTQPGDFVGPNELKAALKGLASLGALPVGASLKIASGGVPKGSVYKWVADAMSNASEAFWAPFVPKSEAELFNVKGFQIPGLEIKDVSSEPGTLGVFYNPVAMKQLHSWWQTLLGRRDLYELKNLDPEQAIGSMMFTRGPYSIFGNTDPRTIPHEVTHWLDNMMRQKAADVGGPSWAKEFQKEIMMRRLWDPTVGEYYSRIGPEALMNEWDRTVRNMPDLISQTSRDKIIDALKYLYGDQIARYGDETGKLTSELLAFAGEPAMKYKDIDEYMGLRGWAGGLKQGEEAIKQIRENPLIDTFYGMRDQLLDPRWFDTPPANFGAGPAAGKGAGRGAGRAITRGEPLPPGWNEPPNYWEGPIDEYPAPIPPNPGGGPFPEPIPFFRPSPQRPDPEELWNKTVRAFGWSPDEMTGYRRRQVTRAMQEILKNPGGLDEIVRILKQSPY